MHEIVCVGDVHEGLSFDYRIDPETGISERALDLHGDFAKAAQGFDIGSYREGEPFSDYEPSLRARFRPAGRARRGGPAALKCHGAAP